MSPPLQPGDLVAFEVAPPQGRKSPSAHSVQRLTDEDARALASRYVQITPPPERRVGHVKFYDQAKGFGFVRDLLNGSELYVGDRDRVGPLRDNDLVFL